MDIHQKSEEVNRGLDHIKWLKKVYSNVSHQSINLSATFES